MIDFGLSKKYHNQCALHLPYSTGHSLLGTPRYSSINAHKGVEQSRRDDLESLVYVLIYFLKSQLPWQHLEAKTRTQKFHRIMQQKIRIPSDELCAGLPDEFRLLLDYTRNLAFGETPNYDYIRALLHTVFTREGYVDDDIFDWTPKLPSPSRIEHSSSEHHGSNTESEYW